MSQQFPWDSTVVPEPVPPKRRNMYGLGMVVLAGALPLVFSETVRSWFSLQEIKTTAEVNQTATAKLADAAARKQAEADAKADQAKAAAQAEKTADALQKSMGELLSDVRAVRDIVRASNPQVPYEGVHEANANHPFKAKSDVHLARNSQRARDMFVSFDAKWNRWKTDSGSIRRHVAVDFDEKTADLVFVRDSRKFKLDNCTVVIRRDDPLDGKDCDVRRKPEGAALTAAIAAGQDDTTFTKFRVSARSTGLLIPPDFLANFSIARQALESAITCLEKIGKDGASTDFRKRCRWVRNTAMMRLNIAGLVYDEIGSDLERKSVLMRQRGTAIPPA